MVPGMKGDLSVEVAVQGGARVPLASVQTPTGGSSEEFCAMGETLTQQRRVSEEGLRVVKLCQGGKKSCSE